MSEFDRSFTRFTELVSDFREIWPGVITEFRQIEREQFAGEGVGRTGKWKPLSAGYAKWKAKRYPGMPILQRTQALFKSLTGNTSDSVVNPEKESLEIGTSLRYAVFHQRGVQGRLAQRKPIDFNEQQRTRLMKVIQKRMLSAGRGKGIALS